MITMEVFMYQKPKSKILSFSSRIKRQKKRKYQMLSDEKQIINNFKMNKYKIFLSDLAPVNDYDIYDEVA
jgi:hypothetical protein